MRILLLIVICVVTFFSGIVLSFVFLYKKIDMLREEKEVNYAMAMACLRLLSMKQDGKDFSRALASKYRRVAIYGMGDVGKVLIKELHKEDFTLLYSIDKCAEMMRLPMKCFKPEDNLPEVDLVIVTVDKYYDEIKDLLESKMQCKITLWEDVIL